ncbi:MAG: hypothetical protein EXS13_11805 [Planctomycetes bacterium]|nr:hypothetical protein [Planctomycetota bacterium]
MTSDFTTADSDGDALTDAEEVGRWITNPSSVDSDGDATGPDGDDSPDVFLFHGKELALLRTSPSLDDTDGDSRSDAEEIDDPIRSNLVAELPRLEIEAVGDIDVRLNIEYAETLGTSTEYGTTLSIGQSSSREIGSADTLGGSLTVGLSLATETKITIPPAVKATFQKSVELGVSYEHEWTSTTGSSTEMPQESSRVQSDSRELTETAASGRISADIRLRNAGTTAYTLENLAVSVLYQAPGGEPGTVVTRTMATLLPPIDSLTLSPGEVTPVLQVTSEEVNADVIKQFLARPDSLVFQPAIYDLSNAEGINFDFLSENTFPRTAAIQIDDGSGFAQTWRVGTNVERTDGGGYSGITLREALRDTLGLVEGSIDGFVISAETIDGVPTGELAIASLVGRSYEISATTPPRPRAFWALLASGSVDTSPVDPVEIVLRAGDATLAALGYPRQVFSDPRSTDGDNDGLTDIDERTIGSDPTNADTDDATLADGIDPFPLIKAAILYVDALAPGGVGTSWASAFDNLRDAIAAAIASNLNAPGDPNAALDDVSQIRVAAGVYYPSATGNRLHHFDLMNCVRMLGGFQGGETRAEQRNSDPLTNGCVLSGDYNNDDPTVLDRVTAVTATTRQDNASTVICAAIDAVSGLPVDATAILDGFLITGGNARTALTVDGGGLALLSGAVPTLRHLLLYHNSTEGGGGAIYGSSTSTVVLEDSVILANYA